jgi:hypothetical protein
LPSFYSGLTGSPASREQTGVAKQVHRGDPGVVKTRMALSDGERDLPILVKRTRHIKLIVDRLHVLERLSKAAYRFHVEGNLEAELRVKDRTLGILSGHTAQVARGLRQSATRRGPHGADRKTVQGVANQLNRNHARMHHDQYLANL